MNSRGQGYALMVVRGTRAHLIQPRAKAALKFLHIKTGTWVGSLGVNHPGTKENNFLAEAAKRIFRR